MRSPLVGKIPSLVFSLILKYEVGFQFVSNTTLFRSYYLSSLFQEKS